LGHSQSLVHKISQFFKGIPAEIYIVSIFDML